MRRRREERKEKGEQKREKEELSLDKLMWENPNQ